MKNTSQKHGVDYLGKQFFPSYIGFCRNEFPQMAVSTRDGNLVVWRMHFAPSERDSAWEEACRKADELNETYEISHARVNPL